MNYWLKLFLAVLWGIEAVFLLIFAFSVLILENVMMLWGYKRGSNKWIVKFDRFVEKETLRGKFIWSQ